jgi:hypothetical protein
MNFPRNGYLLALLLLLPAWTPLRADQEVPPWLPRYYLDIRMDVENHTVTTRQQVTWTNRHHRPANELVFNAHSHYKVPSAEVGFFAKTLELLRMSPREALDTKGEALQIDHVFLTGEGDKATPLAFHLAGDTSTDLVVPLPKAIATGESVTLVIESTVHLPQKHGRWGQWERVTFLSNWLPVVAVYDEDGWHPTPFIPWHQPFYNEAGVYHARVALPAEQKLGCSGTITSERELPDGWKEVDIVASGVRDFALLCSARYQEFSDTIGGEGQQAPVRVHVLAFPEHEHYAREILRIACEAITTYSRWFGHYPYPDFTITEAFFGWNGNECATLVMIDARVFGMPHMANAYMDYLISHETCHQWWYNLVGTNGYCETWMDEALATHFAHRLMTQKHGKNNELLHYPRGLEWLPNIRREDYRSYSLLGTIGRGENSPCVQPIKGFGHLANLFSMCYDKGSRIVGMIEDRIGEDAFLDFIRIVQSKYRYRILHVAEFQHELEAYTGESWKEFFDNWLHGPGLCDWAVEKVHLEEGKGGCHATVILHQKAEYNEQTVLGFALETDDQYSIRIPIMPQAQRVELPEHGAVVESLGPNRVKVEIVLPCKPKQIAVDPDQILIDKNPANNYWKKPLRCRLTPLYTALEETDITCAFDRWNLIAGPYVNRPAYDDPWYARSTLVGVRAGLYRTQHFNGGVYAAYRTDYNDVVIGADGELDHWPWAKTQLGFNVEQRVATFENGRDTAFRAAIYGRYVLAYGSSLYLPPMAFVETFGAYQDDFLPFNRHPVPGAVRYESLETAGIHYHKNLLTPYWDPVAGYQLDLTYAGGAVNIGDTRAAHEFIGQFAMVKSFPDLTSWTGELLHPICSYLADTRLACRIYGAGGVPDRVEYFALGGSTLFRGFSQNEREGSLVWVGSLEWRLPLAQMVQWDVCDHIAGGRNLYAAVFYDVGDALTRGHSVGPVAHAIGGGLRLDVAVFGFVERATLRLDVAKTINADTPLQFWLGVQHPF